MNRRAAGTAAAVIGAAEQRAHVVERDPPVELRESALHDVLKIGRTERASTPQRQQMPPGIGGEPPTLVGTGNAECHCGEHKGRRFAARHQKHASDINPASKESPS